MADRAVERSSPIVGGLKDAAARVWPWVRQQLSTVRRTPDRLLHSRRREEARQRLIAMGPPKSALFICYGNICRSPYAQASFARAVRRLLPREVATSSAGFIGPNRQSPAPALASAMSRGLDLGNHRSTLITHDIVFNSSLIVVMSPEQAKAIDQHFGAGERTIILGDLDPRPIDNRTIRDPWGADDAVFDSSYDRIERCIRAMVDLWAPEPPSRS